MAAGGEAVVVGDGGAELHCTSTAPATASVAIRRTPTSDDPSPLNLIRKHRWQTRFHTTCPDLANITAEEEFIVSPYASLTHYANCPARSDSVADARSRRPPRRSRSS